MSLNLYAETARRNRNSSEKTVCSQVTTEFYFEHHSGFHAKPMQTGNDGEGDLMTGECIIPGKESGVYGKGPR